MCNALARRKACTAGLAALLLGWMPRVAYAQAAEPLRIGISLGLSGPFAAPADMQAKGYRLWERDVNARGGILGRKVELLIRDDRSSTDVAKAIYEEFIQRDRVDHVIGPYSSPITAAVAPLADKHGYPMLAGGAASDALWQQGYRHVFGVSTTAGRYTLGFLALLSQARLKDIAVVAVDDAFSLSAAEGTKRWASRYGLRVASHAVLPKANPDLESAVAQARRSGAQALVLIGHYDEAVKVRTILKRIGWSPDAYYAAVGPALPQYQERLGADVHRTFTTSLWEPREDLRYPKSAEFLREFRAAHGRSPSYHAATAYAAGQILEQAITRAGTAARAKVRDALAELDTHTIVGRYAVDQTGMQVQQTPLIVQWQGSRLEIVWPAELQTAAPLLRE